MLFGLGRHNAIARAQLLEKVQIWTLLMGAIILGVNDAPCWKLDARFCAGSSASPRVDTGLLLAAQKVDIVVVVILAVNRNHQVSSEIK